MTEKLPKPRKPPKPRQPFRIVNVEEFERLLGEALESTSGRARRKIHEGGILRRATVGEIEWAYTARQAIFFALVQKRNYSADVVYRRFVAMEAQEWQRQVAAEVVSLTPSAEAVRRRAKDHPDPREALEARAILDKVAAELAQEPLMLLTEESPCGCIPFASQPRVPLAPRTVRPRPGRGRPAALKPRRKPLGAQLLLFAAGPLGLPFFRFIGVA